jgi:hypothetical protein
MVLATTPLATNNVTNPKQHEPPNIKDSPPEMNTQAPRGKTQRNRRTGGSNTPKSGHRAQQTEPRTKPEEIRSFHEQKPLENCRIKTATDAKPR